VIDIKDFKEKTVSISLRKDGTEEFIVLELANYPEFLNLLVIEKLTFFHQQTYLNFLATSRKHIFLKLWLNFL